MLYHSTTSRLASFQGNCNGRLPTGKLCGMSLPCSCKPVQPTWLPHGAQLPLAAPGTPSPDHWPARSRAPTTCLARTLLPAFRTCAATARWHKNANSPGPLCVTYSVGSRASRAKPGNVCVGQDRWGFPWPPHAIVPSSPCQFGTRLFCSHIPAQRPRGGSQGVPKPLCTTRRAGPLSRALWPPCPWVQGGSNTQASRPLGGSVMLLVRHVPQKLMNTVCQTRVSVTC